ncbi:unnamed protein product [Prorocentrum cordatum]|uniref:Uncharacterized protein n=1 Tax=Prorocentrum cordatum TaxID=2364126 RepID=A0ABN9TAC5_9DINO|nr:unnamed protein product [Polarella glacialis]
MPNLGRLESLVDEHAGLVTRIFEHAERPKVHYLLHIPESIRMHGVSLNCFGPERRHRQVEGVAAHAYAGQLDVHPIKKLTHQHVEALKEENSCVTTWIPRPIEALGIVPWAAGWKWQHAPPPPPLAPPNPPPPPPAPSSSSSSPARTRRICFVLGVPMAPGFRAQAGNVMHCQLGDVHSGDLVLGRDAGIPFVGKAGLFVRVGDNYYCCVDVFTPSGPGTYASAGNVPKLAHVDTLAYVLAFAVVRGGVRPLVPRLRWAL